MTSYFTDLQRHDPVLSFSRLKSYECDDDMVFASSVLLRSLGGYKGRALCVREHAYLIFMGSIVSGRPHTRYM